MTWGARLDRLEEAVSLAGLDDDEPGKLRGLALGEPEKDRRGDAAHPLA